jgi:transcriptional regulator with XRE-family HTH domain
MNNLDLFYQAQGALIRKYRRSAGIEQVSWAARLGVHQSRVSAMERGARAALASNREAVVRELEVSWEEISRRAELVVARSRIAARSAGVSDLDAIDPDARYGLVRFVAEVLYPSDADAPTPPWTAEDAYIAVMTAAWKLVPPSAIAEALEEAFQSLKTAHDWPWGDLDTLRREATSLQGPGDA